MRKLFVVAALMVFSNIIFAQSELVVELTTDNYASETSWKVFDTNKNLVFEKANLESNTSYFDTLQLQETKCFYWTIYDSYGDGMSSPGSPGEYKIFYNGNIVAESSEPNFGDSISVYGLGENCKSYDLSIKGINFSTVQSFSPFYVSFEVLNFGSEEITDIEASYSVNGTNTQTMEINDLHVEFGKSAIVLFPEMLQIKEAGTYNISIAVSKINGTDDEDLSNNVKETGIEILDGFWKKPIHEVFTANWCAPCAAANPILDAVLENYPERYSLIKYQYMNDAYYTAHTGNMANFYGVNGIPAMYVNGLYQYPGEYTTDLFENHTEEVSNLNLSLNANAVGDSVFATLNIESTKDMAKNGYIRLAVVENRTVGNVGTNGETEFFNVFMRFLTAWNGDEFGMLTQGETTTLNYSGSMKNTFVEEMSDLSIIAYVFYEDNYEVLQSEMATIPYTPVQPTITFTIDNNAVNVDTNSFIEITSNKPLVNLDGSNITEFQSIIEFNLESASSDAVNFVGSISDDNTIISITPDNSLLPDSKYTLKLFNVMSNEGIAVSDSISFETQSAVGVVNKSKSLIRVFPNPVNDILTISTSSKTRVRVISIAGVVLFDKQYKNSINVNVSDYPSGIYFIETTINNETQLFKITKN